MKEWKEFAVDALVAFTAMSSFLCRFMCGKEHKYVSFSAIILLYWYTEWILHKIWKYIKVKYLPSSKDIIILVDLEMQ